jgi:hypothetical protein
MGLNIPGQEPELLMTQCHRTKEHCHNENFILPCLAVFWGRLNKLKSVILLQCVFFFVDGWVGGWSDGRVDSCIHTLEMGSTRYNSWGTAESRKVASSIPFERIKLLNFPNPSSRTTALESTHSLSVILISSVPRGKMRPAREADNLATVC